MKSVTASLLLLVSLVLAGCAGGPGFTGPISAPHDQAVVYIYVVHSGMIPRPAQDIYVNGAKIARVPPGGYFIYHANPGQLIFTEDSTIPTGDDLAKALRRQTVLSLNVEQGQVYFVERVFILGIPKGMGSFIKRDHTQALDTISESVQVGTEMASAPPPPAAPLAPAAAPVAPAPVMEKPVEKADVVRAMAVVVEKKHYDSIMTADGDVVADTAEEKAEVDPLIAFLKDQKENRDFDQIAKIEFVSADEAKVGFLWYGGTHVGRLTVKKAGGEWKITSESHTP